MAKKQISRRDFIKGTALGAASLVSASIIGTQETLVSAADMSNDIEWDYEADVVVLGAGGAGLPAALKAMDEGASVIIVEANWDVGGHCSVSGGNLHSGGGTEIQAQYGIDDYPDWVYADHTTGEITRSRYNDRDYVRYVADYMAEAYEYILEKGVLLRDSEPSMHESYLEGGEEPERVGRQTLTDCTTEDWAAYNVGIVPSESGLSTAGIGITRPLERSIRENGGQFLLNYHMDKIHREETFSGRVLGIQASYTPTIVPSGSEPLKSFWNEGNIDETKETIHVKANKAVIIATGGHTGNINFRTMFDPRLTEEYDGLSGAPFSDQDASGELAAMEIGAALGTLANQCQNYGHQITQPGRIGCRYGYGSLAWYETSQIYKLAGATGLTARSYEGLVLVNMLGQRFWNEDDALGGSYSSKPHDYFNRALGSVLIDDESLQGDAVRYGGPIWAIFDADEAERQGWELTQGVVDIDDGRFFSGETLEELAENIVNKYYEDIKMDSVTLVETITKYNSYVDKGKDEEFGKESLEYKIENGPFYAAWATPCCHDSYSGLRVNGKMQVIDIHGELIPGLYCSGESSAGMRVHGLGRVITSGYVSGKYAAAEG